MQWVQKNTLNLKAELETFRRNKQIFETRVRFITFDQIILNVQCVPINMGIKWRYLSRVYLAWAGRLATSPYIFFTARWAEVDKLNIVTAFPRLLGLTVPKYLVCSHLNPYYVKILPLNPCILTNMSDRVTFPLHDLSNLIFLEF